MIANNRAATHERSPAAKNTKPRGRKMYSIVILICSTALSHADCQAKTAVDVVRGPTVDNSMMCGFDAQAMIARTNLVQTDGTEYVKVVCTRAKNAEQWVAEIAARKAAVQSAD
jgi:hypothetical protein